MGCDIHIAIQKRVDGKWVRAERGKVVYDKLGNPTIERETWRPGRNYSLFAALADVRNDGTIKPICEPKGFPPDFEEELRGGSLDNEDAVHEGTWMGQHSATWFTLKELEEWDGWTQKYKDGGWVSYEARAEQLRRYLRRPESWSGHVAGPGIEKVPLKKMDDAIKAGESHPGWYAQIEWEDGLQWVVEGFVKRIELLRMLADDSEDVRLVIAFDN